ncbi:MAG: mechanosensitive ion channel [Bacteroidales bacterium]|nr:mechanosensitive ion channel [Bacteroidales bacterium]
MKWRCIPFLLILLTGLSCYQSLGGQQLFPFSPQTDPQQTDSVVPAPVPLPIPYPDISFKSNETYNQVSASLANRLTRQEVDEITGRVDTLVEQVNLFLKDSALTSINRLYVRDMDNYLNANQLYISRLTDVQASLSERSRRLGALIEELTQTEKRWEVTREQAEKVDFPKPIYERIRKTIHTIDSARYSIQQDMEFLILESDKISGAINRLERIRNSINDARRSYGENLLKRDIPGLFSSLSQLSDAGLFNKRMDGLIRNMKSDVQIFRDRFGKSMIYAGILFLALLGFLLWYKKNSNRMVSRSKFRLTEFTRMLIASPVLVALFIITLLIRLLFPDLPDTFNAISLVVLMIPVMILAVRFYREYAKPWIRWYIVIFTLMAIYEFVFYSDILQRLLLLFLSVAGALLFGTIVLKKVAAERFKNQSFYNLLRAILAIFALMLFAAAIGNLAGTYRMAEFFTLAPLKIVIIALAILIGSKISDTLLYLLLANRRVQKINVFRENFRVIQRKSRRFINFVLWLFFIIYALNLLLLKDPVFSWGERILGEGWKFGAVEISLGSILIFIFVIWFSIFLSRIVKAVLEKDVFTRVTTSRGVPGTIIMLIRIALIAGGFFLAAAAAGMKLTNLSIIIGAFSVGIGFGLQNIFNNMVSGIILAFERPIKVGDTVQVGELTGIVKSIGFRSSTIRSFDGAEVIVPNGNLISNEMINWTLSDSFRRMDIRVGVAYGTDPEEVLELIRQAASENEYVSEDPPPRAYFVGFGESSLDFRLLAWSDIEHRLQVESDLAVAINRKINEAGIEIPFPQVDLHVRSDFREDKRISE